MRSDGGFEALGEKLLRAGIAPRRVKRYLAELDDHLAELTAREVEAGHAPGEASARARAALGSDDELAQSWLANPRLKSLTARAPWLVFVAAPPFAVLAAFLVPLLAIIAIGKATGMMTGPRFDAPIWYQNVITVLASASNFVLPLFIASLLVALAIRQRVAPLWPLVGIGLITLLDLQWHVVFSVSGHSNCSIVVGSWLLTRHLERQYWQLGWIQMAVTMLPAALLMRRYVRP